MGMKLKSGADLCGFQLTNFCVQGEASAPSDAALGRKYFHTNATDDVATGISLLNRERIYLGEGAWRATAYLDDIAAINEKLNLITGDTDTDTLINNLKDLEEFLKDFSETDKLKSLLDGKLSTSGGTISAQKIDPLVINGTSNEVGLHFKQNNVSKAWFGWNEPNGAYLYNSKAWAYLGIKDDGTPHFNSNTLIHSGNIGEQTVAKANVLISKTGIQYSYNFNTDKIFVFGNGAEGYKAYIDGSAISLRYGANNATGLMLNESGNVTIGGSDLAGTSAKLYVNGGKIIQDSPMESWHYSSNAFFKSSAAVAGEVVNVLFGKADSKHNSGYIGHYHHGDGSNLNGITFGGHSADRLMTIQYNGNVLIGTTDDSGYKLDVNGKFIANSNIDVRAASNGNAGLSLLMNNTTTEGYLFSARGSESSKNLRLYYMPNSNDTFKQLVDFTPSGDVHIHGNLIVDKEVSAGGAGAEEGTSGGGGSVDFHSEKFMPSTSTLKEVNHNLGKDVIVQVYEEGATSDTWNLVMVDVEIVSATKLYLRFGKLENTYHKVVVMGAGV